MAKSKSRKRGIAVPQESVKVKVFPFAQYALTVGIYTVLLLSAALLLPRTTFLLVDVESEQHSSRDKPQHPFLIPLTAKPLLTVSYILAGSFILQVWWAGRMREWRSSQSPEGDLRRDQEQGNMQRFNNAVLATLLMSFAAHILLILFGAPVTSHGLHTYALACLVSILTVFTPTYLLGIPSLAQDPTSLVHRLIWTRLFAELSPRNPIEVALVYPVVGTVLGCWFGAFPIPLDWGRPWQSWPLTTSFGSVFGHVLGQIYAVIMVGRRVLTTTESLAVNNKIK